MIIPAIQLVYLILIGIAVLMNQILALRSRKTAWKLPDFRRPAVFFTDLFFWAAVATWALCSVSWVLFPHGRSWAMPLTESPAFFLQIVGVLTGALGLTGILTGIYALGSSFRTSIDYDEPVELKTGGVYRFSRNPMALGLILQGWAAAFMQQTVAIVLAACCLHMCNLLRVRFEEQFLSEKLGADYHSFRSRTPRYLPFPGLR